MYVYKFEFFTYIWYNKEVKKAFCQIRKEEKNMKEKLKKFYPRIILIILVILGIFTSFSIGAKILKTSTELFAISSSIASIEDISKRSAPGHQWSPELVEEYENLQEQRQAIYESDDLIIRWFSTSEKILQFIIILTVLFVWSSFICIPVQWVKKRLKQ